MDTNVVTIPDSAATIDLASIKRKTRFSGTIMKTSLAGAVVDIGLGVPGVIHISQLQEGHTNRVEDVVQVGQVVEVWVRRVDPKKQRIELTMIRPLELEWREITQGMALKGKVVRLEKFGVFVDVGAERPGLVHISEMTHGYIKSPSDVVKEGDEVDVQVLEVNMRKRQIKLSMKALEEKPEVVVKESRPRKEKTKEKASPAEEGEKEEATPTAMEMALREAMDRTKVQEPPKEKSKRKPAATSNEIEDILARTLEHKVRTHK